MNINFLAGILGIVEGLTEFLPVSSTAHLRIFEKLFSLELDSPYWKMFSIVIQLGAVLALPFCFWERIAGFAKTFPRPFRADSALAHPVGLVMLAFLGTAVPAFALRKLIDTNLESLTVIGIALVVGGVIMWLVDVQFRAPRVERLEDMTIRQALIIGLVQTLSAVFPGTSRSMCTIAAGQMLGLSRSVALEFSFFVSLPTMLVATVFAFVKDLKPSAGEAPHPAMTFHQKTALAIGFLVSFLVAVFVVKWFTKWVRRSGFIPFALYRLLVGAGVLLFLARM